MRVGQITQYIFFTKQLTDLGDKVINNVDQYKEIINAKMNLSRIYKLAEDIMATQNLLSSSPTKNKNLPKQRKENVSSVFEFKKNLHEQVSSFCDEYSLFIAYVNVFSQLVQKNIGIYSCNQMRITNTFFYYRTYFLNSFIMIILPKNLAYPYVTLIPHPYETMSMQIMFTCQELMTHGRMGFTRY